eukprot:NODE_2220_length_816_cov_143.438070_g1552_i0.p1 GENE.NODE_2220_length_816_cov_143.438070_g1552_i0~~NODE_2220_length_816_cov_143.438070_g1552_i0.p1  ORF type:complete len:219 (-),score=57.17 NODE_2220_length_816_cov_143.438070_g1552_i0:158-787(-)
MGGGNLLACLGRELLFNMQSRYSKTYAATNDCPRFVFRSPLPTNLLSLPDVVLISQKAHLSTHPYTAQSASGNASQVVASHVASLVIRDGNGTDVRMTKMKPPVQLHYSDSEIVVLTKGAPTACSYYNSATKVFDFDGVTTDTATTAGTVQCDSTHLTSFAVVHNRTLAAAAASPSPATGSRSATTASPTASSDSTSLLIVVCPPRASV